MILFLFGLMCLPFGWGYGKGHQRGLSVFNNLVDLGAFIKIGLILMAIGVIAFFLSALVPGESDPDYWD